MHRLRVLKVRTINIDGLIAILQCSPNLEVLAIHHGTDGRIEDTQSSSMISLSALTDFNVKLLEAENWRGWANLFQHLHCPSLVNFSFISRSSDDVYVPLKSIFTRSRPPLERLRINTFSGRQNERTLLLYIAAFLDILKILPNLIFLDVYGFPATKPEFVEALAGNHPDGHGLCPRLTRTNLLHSYDHVTLSDGREMV